VGAIARSYDNAGNTTAIGGTAKEFVYDDTGRMSQVKQNAIVQRNYAYNGKGEQVRKYVGTANTYTLYDEAGHWLGDYDNTGAALQQAIWLDDLPVGLIANGNQLHYIEPDHLGTPRVVIEVARNVPVWTWDLKSEAFGNSVPNQDPDGDSTPLVFDMRFPGQRYDAASGMNYNYFRDYDFGGGRYIQSDPIGLDGGRATYSYAENSPAVLSDKLGLAPNNQIRDAMTPIEGFIYPIADMDGSTCRMCDRVEAKCLTYWTMYDAAAALSPDAKSLPKACKTQCQAACVIKNYNDPNKAINCAKSCGVTCAGRVQEFRELVCKEAKAACLRNSGLKQVQEKAP